MGMLKMQNPPFGLCMARANICVCLWSCSVLQAELIWANSLDIQQKKHGASVIQEAFFAFCQTLSRALFKVVLRVNLDVFCNDPPCWPVQICRLS